MTLTLDYGCFPESGWGKNGYGKELGDGEPWKVTSLSGGGFPTQTSQLWTTASWALIWVQPCSWRCDTGNPKPLSLERRLERWLWTSSSLLHETKGQASQKGEVPTECLIPQSPDKCPLKVIYHKHCLPVFSMKNKMASSFFIFLFFTTLWVWVIPIAGRGVILACMRGSSVALGREFRHSWHRAQHWWVVCVGLGLSTRLNEIDNGHISWLSSNFLNHHWSIWEIPALWVLLSPERIQKISSQIPLQLEHRHMNWLHQSELHLMWKQDLKEKGCGKNPFCWQGGQQRFLREEMGHK